MTCTNCRDIREVDGELPRCETGEGCIIPALSESAARILEIRGMLVSLHELVGSGPILEALDVTREELAILAEFEDALKAMDEEDKGHGG